MAATGLLGANQTEMMTDILAEFLATRGAWTMKFEDGWFAYFEDELPLGPFETETEAAEAANRAGWLNRFNPHLSESLPLLVGPVALPKMAQLFGSEGRSALLDLDEPGRLLLGSLDHGPLLRDHALALTH